MGGPSATGISQGPRVPTHGGADRDDDDPLARRRGVAAAARPGAGGRRASPAPQLAPDQGDGLWRGSIRVKFGPTVAVFRGEASLAFDDAARTCTIEGRGIDGRGASRALASGVVKVSGSDATELAVDGSFTVSGPLETFANAGGVHVARALLAEFSANWRRRLPNSKAGAVPPDDPLPAATASCTACRRHAAPHRR